MAKNDRTVEGFCFTSKEEADLARIELEKIKMMDDKLNYHDSEMVKSVYDRAILNRTFRTPVGHQFLYHLRRELLESGYTDADLKPIPLTVRFAPTARSITAHKTENTGQAPKKKQSSSATHLLLGFCAYPALTMTVWFVDGCWYTFGEDCDW